MKKLLLLSAVAVIATGCSGVSKKDFDMLRADVASAKESSDKAYQAAQQANMNAEEAKAMSIATQEKLNRVFRKSQMK